MVLRRKAHVLTGAAAASRPEPYLARVDKYFILQSALAARGTRGKGHEQGEVVMDRWLKRARGAIGMGITWAAGWALTGLLIGVTSVLTPWFPFWDDFFRVFDAPLPAMALPGFIGGVIFSGVLGVAGRRRSFHELSLPRFAAWGAAGGLLLAMVPDTLMTVGLASPGPDPLYAPWQLTAIIAAPLMLLSAASAAGSLLLARRAERRTMLDADGETGAELAGAGLAHAALAAGADGSKLAAGAPETLRGTREPDRERRMIDR